MWEVCDNNEFYLLQSDFTGRQIIRFTCVSNSLILICIHTFKQNSYSKFKTLYLSPLFITGDLKKIKKIHKLQSLYHHQGLTCQPKFVVSYCFILVVHLILTQTLPSNINKVKSIRQKLLKRRQKSTEQPVRTIGFTTARVTHWAKVQTIGC